MTKTVVVMASLIRPLIESHLPDWVEAHYFSSREEAFALAPEAEIGWFDMWDKAEMAETISRATKLKWLNSIYAGVDRMPLAELRERGTIITNGAGLLSDPIAEYVILGMLSIAKGYHKVVQAQGRKDWLRDPPGRLELTGAKVLILGYGGIGQAVEKRLVPFGCDITKVRRNAGPGALGPDQWRARLGEFDWLVVSAPSTPETRHMIGKAELGAMKPGSGIVNVARGALIDHDALAVALKTGTPGHAFLDATEPEPLPPESPLWAMDNVQISMHLSGPSQSSMFQRASARFLENLSRFRAGEPLSPLVDLSLGY